MSGVSPAQRLERLAGVGRLADLVAARHQVAGDQVAERVVVLDHQDPPTGGWLAAGEVDATADSLASRCRSTTAPAGSRFNSLSSTPMSFSLAAPSRPRCLKRKCRRAGLRSKLTKAAIT